MTENIEFISAGAGSGKTYTLTTRLASLLESGTVKPAGVIATTFTRLAAGELKERVRESLMKAGNVSLANQMGQAAINTVNGVCGELLQRFSFEAGLSPEQQVLDEGEAVRLFREALDQVIGDDMGRVRKLNALAQRLGFEDKGKPQWHDHIKSIVASARANDCSHEQLSGFAAESANDLLAHFRQPIKRNLDKQLLEAIDKALASIDTDLDKTKGTAKYLSTLKAARQALARDRLTWSEWVALSKSTPTAKSKEQAEPVQRIAEDFESHPRLHQDLRDYIQAVFDLAALSLEAYQTLKHQQGLLDFVDQEQKLYHLLEKPVVRETLGRELQLLMVDEFQDTSPIQLALFVRLAALADKVIWVGDVKQAIYGFRGSDPLLMQTVLKAVNKGGGKSSVLGKSWRSRPALVNYCNHAFSAAFAGALSPEAVKLEPAHKEISKEAAVATWAVGKNKAQKLAAMAAGIRELIEADYQVVDKRTRKPRSAHLGDVAVLCRSNDRLKELASACAEEGIAVSYKRPGLLATPECTLALACLRRMADPGDTLATAEIRTLGSSESAENWLPQRLTHIASEHNNQRWGEAGEGALPVLQALAAGRAVLNSLTPTETLSEALERGQVRSTVNCWGPTAQRSRVRLANIDCLRALARDYEQHCDVRNLAATVPGLLMWLNELRTSGEDWQAVSHDEDTVTLVTYHGAKGLEWPIVIAADLDAKIRTRIWGLSVLGRSDGFDMADPLKGRRLRFWPYPFGKQEKDIAVKDRIEQSAEGQEAYARALDEERRLLYVTFTRARDLLVLSQPDKGCPELLAKLNADWLFPGGETLELPCGKKIPTACHSPVPREQTSKTAAYQPHWLPVVEPVKGLLPRSITPSKAEQDLQATTGQIEVIGERLKLAPVQHMSLLGRALHGAITACINRRGQFTEAQVEQLLAEFQLQDAVAAADVLAASQRFIQHCEQTYDITQWLAEYPISYVNQVGQELSGFIDLLLETPQGWIIIDHKSSPAPKSDWPEIARSYSGQLAAYHEVVEIVSGKPVIGCWIHFFVAGGMVEVVSKTQQPSPDSAPGLAPVKGALV